MSIHQLSVAYQADQDRLLVRVRTHDGQLYELWLTRRLLARLWRPLQVTASAISLNGLSSGSTVLPEAREMMSETLRQRSGQAADFKTPFEEDVRERPLGDAPMLVTAIDITALKDQQVELAWRDAAQRRLAFCVGADLLNNLLTLMERALEQSEWGALGTTQSPGQNPAAHAAPPRVLN